MIGRIGLSLVCLALASLAALVLIGLWDRYSQETASLGFDGIYERYLASQAGFPDEPIAYRTVVELNRKPHAENGFLQVTPFEE
jgi:hypothetical protein